LWRQLRWWRGQKRQQVDERAWVGDKHTVAGRLVALSCPEEIVAKRLARLERRAREHGRPVTERQKELCHWTVLWTNVSVDHLSSEQVWHVYRLRWQIELLIRRFKSEGGLGRTPATKRERVQAEWYLKLLGQIVRQWLQLLSGGPLRAVNSQELGRVVVDSLGELLEGLRTGLVALFDALWRLQELLAQVRPRTRRQNATAGQWLADQERVGASAPGKPLG
jgi:hypothetical protein